MYAFENVLQPIGSAGKCRAQKMRWKVNYRSGVRRRGVGLRVAAATQVAAEWRQSKAVAVQRELYPDFLRLL